MDLNNLWIGDPVQIISSGKKGKFAGIAKDGRARVSYNEKILLVKAHNIKTYEEKMIDDLDDLLDDQKVTYNIADSSKFNTTLDLHIEKLNPSIRNSQPEHILNYQLTSCQNFIEKAIELGKSSITIIHGRGQGRLKAEVIHLLNYYDRVTMIETTNSGGAQMVLLRQF